MIARHAVLLTPSIFLRPTQLLFCKQNASVGPLFATLTSLPQLTENTATLSPFFAILTASAPVSPVFATLTQTPGVTSFEPKAFESLMLPKISLSIAAPRAPMHPDCIKTKIPLLYFQQLTHSSAIRWRWGVGAGTWPTIVPGSNFGECCALPVAGPATTLGRKHIEP
jgi:hypothetical protein